MRDKTLEIRLSANQLDAWQRAADFSACLTLDEYVRFAVRAFIDQQEEWIRARDFERTYGSSASELLRSAGRQG